MPTPAQVLEQIPRGVPPMARRLGLIAVVPFALGLVFVLIGGTRSLTGHVVLLAFKSYAATVLAFLGGVHWGVTLALRQGQRRDPTLIISVIPPIIGWITMLLSPKLSFSMLAAAFLFQGGFDMWAFMRADIARWYARLRLELTVLVVVILGLSAFMTPVVVR